MNLPMSWLKDYFEVGYDVDINLFCHKMTMSGSKVEGYENKGDVISKVVVGKVVGITQHPDADKLVVVQADIGESENIQIVTGATNLFVGAYIPVALDGSTLAGGLKIKKSKLRGVVSNGMFCSVEEFGFTRDDYPEAPENGIYIFEKEQELGANVKNILELDDDVVEFEITSNRPDCFSIMGLAREANATFGENFLEKNKEFFESISDTSKFLDSNESMQGMIDIEVKNQEICPRYMCRVIKDVEIKASPQWLRHRLTASGIRPINNIVDITNYVMLEFGQPMHAYNYDKIAGKKLIVRNAEQGEKLTTLDGVEREFDSNVLVIQDENKVVDLAGIMGGENSMIIQDTKTILLESANFNGPHIRLTAKKVGLRTDASSKYEKGLDPNLCELALNRACQLINELGCGRVLSGEIDICLNKEALSDLKKVDYSPARINKLLGTSIKEQDMTDIFKLIEVEVKEIGDGVYTASVPTFRPDLETESDLAEEIARFYGYDNIIPRIYTGTPTVGKKTYKQQIEDVIIKSMVSCGLSQALMYSFESPKVFDKMNVKPDCTLRKTISISNPLGEDFSIMRTSPLNGMLNSLSVNYSRRNKEVKLFEMGKIYIPKTEPLSDMPQERDIITIGMYGGVDFYDAKGVFENLFKQLKMENKVEYFKANTDSMTYMHPGRTASIKDLNGKVIGFVGEVHPKASKNYEIGEKVYFGYLYVRKLVELSDFGITYKPLPKYPSITRDIAMVVKEEVSVKEIEKIIKLKGGKLLESIMLFDIYKGNQIKEGYKSVAYNIEFRSSEKTLTDEEISPSINKILKELEGKLEAQLRDK
ncbi:MAG: phenylalanine--tRNA ligase subunit beta [bacterium]